MTADEVVAKIAAVVDTLPGTPTLEEEVNTILARSNRLSSWQAYKIANPTSPVVLEVNRNLSVKAGPSGPPGLPLPPGPIA